MPAEQSTQPFYLIVADHSLRLFSVEGPMTDDRPWQAAAQHARNNQRRLVCGPAGPDRDRLVADYQQGRKLTEVSPGSVVRPCR